MSDGIDESNSNVAVSTLEYQQNVEYSLEDPVDVSSPIATKTRTRDVRLPFSPRFILDRINSIDEYNSKYNPNHVAFVKRKREQTKKGISLNKDIQSILSMIH